ncbi:MAG: site-specific integrase [Bacteroidetes bacterium]|nr:site-specific integrase [Bacteroidota bacterium]
MSVEKKFVPDFRIYSPRDLSKEWFIYWILDGKRRKRKGGINRCHTYESRMKAANAVIHELKESHELWMPISLQMVRWIETRRGVWKPKTFRNEMCRLEKFLEYVGAQNVTNNVVRAFFVHISKTLHKCTYHHYLRFIKAVCNGIGKPELCDGVERFKYTSTPAKYFQSHQIERIKKYLLECDPELWLYCQFVYYCFIRPGELRLLRVSDIQFDDWKICMRSDISKNKKQQYVTIPAAFRPIVLELRERYPNEYVFPSKKDISKPLGIQTMRNRWRKRMKEIGFGLEFQLYGWKHTGAVGCVRSGVNVKELQIQLRHHSLDEVNKYLRQLGVWDLENLEERFPAL